MDITQDFKNCVKAAKLGSSALAALPKPPLPSSASDTHAPPPPKSRKEPSEFELRANKLVAEIRALKQFLLRNRRPYLNSAWHVDSPSLSSTSVNPNGMTDADRDEIDAWTQRLVKDCSDAVKSFRQEAVKLSKNLQTRQHREAVVHLIDEYLKAVCSIYSEQRAVRLKRMVERRNLARLSFNERFTLRKRKNKTMNFDAYSSEFDLEPPPAPRPSNVKKEEKSRKSSSGSDEDRDVGKKVDVGKSFFEDEDEAGGVEDLSPAELLVLESENATLINRLHSMKDDVKQIEGKVIKIAQLQEVFTKKVLEQERDIDVIGQVAIGTTENVVEGNEQLREAMKKNAGLRVWILFFLLMMSFAILFLDWYNK